MNSARSVPSEAVLAAFGVYDNPVILPGGQGRTWRAGQVVLKPVDFLPETLWRADVLSGLSKSSEFRVARPVRSREGGWVADGWEAHELLAGQTDASRPDHVVPAGIAFHEAIAELPRPEFLDVRDDPWTYGDRVAWEEAPVEGSPPYRQLVAGLVEARRPVELRDQAVHGDLLGNVLFADGLPPAIIDWPVYWRPSSWASAVAVVDALCWYDAKPDLATRWSHLPEWGQMLLRALIYRVTTDDAVRGHWTPDHLDRYRPTIELALSFAR